MTDDTHITYTGVLLRDFMEFLASQSYYNIYIIFIVDKDMLEV